ncbi:C2 domain-containing protein 5 [Polistes fuscatus]|uniref:C2 domain-containing protein 5 n=1 Tax=Polistes fuscatus TaxID=30207 RepID=UPI001CA9A854|nr:C2 domain-containing protein 5 [Polistes fuscatus]XP_043495135.1 C2 domain-containing protein 5 [Polistes fuscatus]XP_043495136.1 C2 domain-containing protein 5 [Polistes fuscatus]
MPGKIKVKVLAGRNLPVMDRSGDTTDAYVELKFGNVTYKTDVCRKSLNPQWNSEWYKFEVDDAELQDEPLQIRLMDHDTYSANDAIGKVYINLNPLLLPGITPLIKNVWTLEASLSSSAGSQGSVMTGWLPVYDTMHGIRGEVNIIVKVELFLDFNKFRQSSCGVQFFYSPNIPYGYHAQVIHGFVEELIVSDDPEYKWIDKIRTPRASNEARQTLFFKLSGEVQRKIGLKALDLGGNAVIGYLQNFDLEGESGIVARGIGTAVTLVKVHDVFNSPSDNAPLEEHQEEASFSPSYPLPSVPPSTTTKTLHSPATKTHNIIPLHRRSSDSDLSITPKGNSLAGSDRSMGGFMKQSAAVVRTMNQDALEMLEYPFITMQQYPPGFVVHIGGLVSSRSVKLLERISNLEEPESRDAWWTEIRMEVRSHARALACNVVIGYKEETSICDDVCVLNASGTAAVINLHNSNSDQDNVFVTRLQQGLIAASIESERDKPSQKSSVNKTERSDIDPPNHTTNPSGRNKCASESNDHESYTQSHGCSLCHLPYSGSNIQFKVNMSKCAICKRAKVPDVMFTTIELLENIPMTGRGCFIQATVCKNKKDLRGELNAKEISDCLPFLEYELYCLLLNKLKMKGMNAIFGLKLQVSIGERFIIGMAVGTAVFLTALPNPSIPQIAAHNSWHNEEQLVEIQQILSNTVKKNIEFYQLKPIGDNETGRAGTTSDTDDSDEDLPELDVALGSRDACILEVDDLEDIDRISLLIDDKPPDDFHVVNTQTIPGLEDLEIVRNLQMFTQVSRAKIPTGLSASMPPKYFARLLQTIFFKLRRMVPCALCDMQFKVALPEQDEIQLSVVGMALGLGEPVKSNKYKRKMVVHQHSKDEVKKSDEHEMIFNLEEDHIETTAVSDNMPNIRPTNPSTLTVFSGRKSRPRSPLRSKIHTTHRHKHVPLKERYGVDITPLSYLPGGRIERYLGNLNFFFIRESTSVRENGGLSGFTHSFVMEILAIVRAHITALGGNAMVAFFMTQCVLLHNVHKNQGQCLINVGGDVVFVSYFANEKRSGSSNY